MISTLVLAALVLGQAPTEDSTSPRTPDARAEVISEPGVPRTLLVHGGRIHLGDGAGSVVEAVLVEDGRVVAAGTEHALGSRLSEVNLTRIDLKGAVAVPGFQDAHGHVLRLGQDLSSLNLAHAEDLDSVLLAVAGRAATLPAGEWLLGYGLRQSLWGAGEGITAKALARLSEEHPIYLRREDGHAAWVNAIALKRAGLDGVLDPPPRLAGGEVVLDADSRATGRLEDSAMLLFEELFTTRDEGQLEAQLLAAQAELLKQGWTCVQDMGISPATVRAYERLRDKGLLRLRIVAYLEGNRGLSEELRARYPAPIDSKDLFAVQGVVFRLDGALSTRAAALNSAYSDEAENYGELLLSEERLTALVHEAWQAGLQPAVTAVGDRANRVALDVFERMLQVDEGFARMRPRIEHAQVVAPRDFPRFPALEILPSMQPAHAVADMTLIEERLGEVRSRGAYAWRSLAPGLMQLAFGSDQAQGIPDPLLGIHAARTRQGAGGLGSDSFVNKERLNGRKALAGFTSCAAYAAHQEDRRGRLSPGYWADMTILDLDPTECEPDEVLSASVLMTLINGELAHQR